VTTLQSEDLWSGGKVAGKATVDDIFVGYQPISKTMRPGGGAGCKMSWPTLNDLQVSETADSSRRSLRPQDMHWALLWPNPLERKPAQDVLSARMAVVWSPNHPLECQMSKRKPATASKHRGSPKIAAKAQRANQAIVRSPKHSHLRSVGAGSTESPPKRYSDSKQEAPAVEKPATALHDDCKRTMSDNDLKKGFDFSSATANVRAYQAKLQEIAQVNMHFAFEFAQKLATIRSPLEIFSVLAEFTSKRIAMFQKHSKEMAELSIKR
jgi:hypothetical protein